MNPKPMLVALLVLSLVPIVLANTAPLDGEISPEDQARFDQILEPVVKIYNFIKYIASVVAGIFLLFAGIGYMSAGSDPGKKEQSKNIFAYVVIGLIVIWASPIIVSLLV